MFNQEQKYTGFVTIPSVYVLVGNKNIPSRTKMYRSKIYNKCYTETINWFGHELMDITLTQNKMTVCVVVTNEESSLPKHSLCVFSNNKNTWFTEITFVVNMENNYDWLAINKT
jgi:hypothetical protein